MATLNLDQINRLIKPLTIKDLRIQCRSRGLTPAGGLESLRERIRDSMLETKNYDLINEDGSPLTFGSSIAGVTTKDVTDGYSQNNYTRPDGQNVGNYITDRSSSRVLAPPGGFTQIVFGDEAPSPSHARNNNYSRPGGQNVGNFLTEKNTSKVSAPPGGRSTIQFG